MKCEVCLDLLEEFLDGELAGETNEQINEHLITCNECSASFATLNAEQEIFARYDRELEVPPFLWTRVAAHTVSESKVAGPDWRHRLVTLFTRPMAAAVVILLFAIAIGIAYVVLRREPTTPKMVHAPQPPIELPKSQEKQASPEIQGEPKSEAIAAGAKPKRIVRPVGPSAALDQSDVLSSDPGYLDMDDRDTARHIEQSQNLLRSIKNVSIADGDDEIDVTYDKALSRRLLNENVVLRRDAEMKAKFPTKTLLADLEPLLIDIANLPDHARAEDVRVIKERVQKTEIVAALVDYQDRGATIVKE
ncbi:MAG TPA: zf-HC2 domain-containing protein [Pyrinomonadaceae bacterium]|nr:zf-HC2 domain-containing protein [Pyrinomonadaceae bacterium]